MLLKRKKRGDDSHVCLDSPNWLCRKKKKKSVNIGIRGDDAFILLDYITRPLICMCAMTNKSFLFDDYYRSKCTEYK